MSQAPLLLLQRKPYLTGSPPSRQEHRWRQSKSRDPSIAPDREICQTKNSSFFWVGTRKPATDWSPAGDETRSGSFWAANCHQLVVPGTDWTNARFVRWACRPIPPKLRV